MRLPHSRRRSGPGRSPATRALAAATALVLSTLGLVFAAPTASAATLTVSQKNLSFNPATLTIAQGDTVTWHNEETDGTTHSVVQSGGSEINSPDMPPGASFSYTFTNTGTYNITCRFHPDMFMTVEVGGSGGNPPPTTNPPTTTTTEAPPSTTTEPPSTTTEPPSSSSSVTTTSAPTSSSTSTPTSGTTAPSTTPGLGGLPVGVGPVPVSFHLTDNNGSWYDTNLNLFGTRSLAVAELPRVNLGKLLGGALPNLLGGNLPLLGNGAVGQSGASGLLGGAVSQLSKLLPTGSSTPAVGNLGVDPGQLLNVPALRGAVSQILPTGDPRIAQANTLLDQFQQQVAAQPANLPISLDKLPVGANLMGLLKDLTTFASNDITLPVTVNFNVSQPAAASAHTATSLIWPDGAKGFPFDQGGAWVGNQSVQLTEPGLYAFQCKIHPYMLGAVVVDDPLTPGLDFGKKLHVNSRALTVPSNADIITQLVTKFFNITAPGNWQHYSATQDTTWNPSDYPPAPILTYDENGKPQLIPLLSLYLKQHQGVPKTLPAANKKPATPGVGEVWIDTEMEQYANKTKVGSATRVNAQTWNVERKVALPQVNMNNPHNMWTDRDEKVIYQTEWFNNKLDVFDRQTGQFIRQIEVGPDPSHVMSRTDTDQLHVALNGGGAVMELSPGATKIDRRIPVQLPGEKIAHPHAHWMTGDGTTMITPNVNLDDATIVDIPTGKIRHDTTGEFPIASGMTPDGSKAYEADFGDGTVACISLKADACVSDTGTKVHGKIIDEWANYDPVKGPRGDWGGLSIQIPVAPDNSAVLVANTLTGNITVIDPKTDRIVKFLPCDSGCHGINFGAKKGGGYYAYVSSKFSNRMIIVDTDPNGDGRPDDAAVVGSIALAGDQNTATDDKLVDYAGFGGMGVLPIPLAYEGWVEKAPGNAVNDQLTCRQRNPVKYAAVCK
ncbi:cupredoxin domain-containing protein [Amycolatopsis cynarae]|uniref:Cupredoxin domain-containing protein n=1 Tax=Amycolatopsis cynarae TaxID=2995223 RepID=A0ABY7AZH8_9PSEU|nr:plastocyanin/azurin family copper-binding protein [Amycolatopsis sp. HUAS 11-8]WAL65432.1 cupredoxin domain-containing protein [Amycolatopsis sp. HUAS 11-8]